MEEASDSADLLLIESRDRIRDLGYRSPIEPASLSNSTRALGEHFAMPNIWTLEVITHKFVRDLNPTSYRDTYTVAKEGVVNNPHSKA